MAPPKRKTGGGRVTPKGTRPGESTRRASTSDDGDYKSSHHEVAASSRYTPKAQRRQLIPPNLIPVLMCALLIVGGLVIMAGYLVGEANRWFTGVGLVCILGGLWFATKWE
ncbi:MAG: cell division protein CrgA [Ilumatobacter sp.]